MKLTAKLNFYRICSTTMVTLASLLFASPYIFIAGYLVWRTVVTW